MAEAFVNLQGESDFFTLMGKLASVRVLTFLFLAVVDFFFFSAISVIYLNNKIMSCEFFA
jgi:hypothetical protein